MFGKKKTDNGPERFREENTGKKVAGGIGIAVVVVAVLILLGGSFYSLKENEYAVITTFGVPKVVEESGIHVKIPLVQELSRVPKTINGFTIGYDSSTGAGRVRTVVYLYHICRITKKSLHLFIKCDKMGAIWENAAIGLPYIGLRPQRERDGGIRLRAMPGFLPGASA